MMLPKLEENQNFIISLFVRIISLTFFILFLLVIIGLVIIFFVNIDLTVDASGVLEPKVVLLIRSPENGVIQDINVTAGDSVKKGQVIAALGSEEIKDQFKMLQLELISKRLEYNKEKESLPIEVRQLKDKREQSQAQLIRAKAIFREMVTYYYPTVNPDSLLNNYIPGNHIAIDKAIAEVKVATIDVKYNSEQLEKLYLNDLDVKQKEIELTSLEEKIKDLNKLIKRYVIISPIKGIVLTEGIENLIGANVAKGKILFEISDLYQWQVVMYVPEQLVEKIKIDNTVKVEIVPLEASRNYEMLTGKVIAVAKEPAFTNDLEQIETKYIGLFRVTVSLDIQQLKMLGVDKLKRKYSVKARIITQSDRIAKLLWNYVRHL